MSKRIGDPGYADGWCIHYRYVHERDRAGLAHTCEAGIDYSTFGPGPGQPCFLDKGKSRPDAKPCGLLRLPTSEEITAHEDWIEGRMNLLGRVMQGIRPWRDQWNGKSHSEVVECPACAGRLHLSIAAYNGHVHGKCETEHCAEWME